jgi:hypothetical protein
MKMTVEMKQIVAQAIVRGARKPITWPLLIAGAAELGLVSIAIPIYVGGWPGVLVGAICAVYWSSSVLRQAGTRWLLAHHRGEP